MEIRVLRYFVEVAKEENMTRAATNLHVTQPTLSRQLKNLEEELGQKLFIRGNYNVHLTEEGKILYKRAEDILSMVDKTTAEFKVMNEFMGGDIYIGCAESDGISYIAKAAKTLQNKFSNIHFHLYSGNAETVTDRLDKGLLDFAVIVQNIDISKYNYINIPSTDQWGLIMRKDSLLALNQSIKLDELLNLPLILSRQGITNDLPDWFQKNSKKLNVVATYDLLFNASIFVREGIGYALGLNKLINIGPDSDLCFRPIYPIFESPMYIIWNQHQVFSNPAKLLLNELKKILES